MSAPKGQQVKMNKIKFSEKLFTDSMKNIAQQPPAVMDSGLT
jgi:hypothetical protein